MEGNPRIGEERVAEVLHSRLSVPQFLVHHIDEHKQRRYGDDLRPAKLVEFVCKWVLFESIIIGAHKSVPWKVPIQLRHRAEMQ